MKISLVKPRKELCWRNETKTFFEFDLPFDHDRQGGQVLCGIITTILSPSILSILSREVIFAAQQAFAASPKGKLTNMPKLPNGEGRTVPPTNPPRSYDRDLIVHISWGDKLHSGKHLEDYCDGSQTDHSNAPQVPHQQLECTVF
jgi:hypothetical protein